MAYPVSQEWKNRVYGDRASYTYSLTINGTQIPDTLIENMKLSNPIVDSEQKYFYIGTFISQKLTIKFRNLNGIDLHSGDVVNLFSMLEVGENQFETIPVGIFLIDELSEDYKTKCEINCIDYAVKFSDNVDYSNAFYHLTQDIEIDETKTYFKKVGEGKTEKFEEVGTPVLVDIGNYYENTKEATLLEILQWLCRYFGVPLGTYPLVNNNVLTQQYSNELTGKRYVSYIAEMFGGNAKIDRTGTLNIIPLKTTPVIEINAYNSKEWVLGEQYKISRVTWDDALRNFTFGDGSYNTLYIRSDNFFVTEESQIQNIYNAIEGFEVYSIKQEAPADLSLDAWDLVNFSYNNNLYTTWNNNTVTITASTFSKLETKIPSSAQENTTNRIGTETRFRKLRTEIDRENNRINILAGETQGNKQQISQLSIDVQKINNIFQLQGGTNLIKNSAFLLTDETWDVTELIQDEGYVTPFGKSYTTLYLGQVKSNAEIKIKNSKITSKTDLSNIFIPTLNKAHTLSFKYKMDDYTTATVKLKNPSDDSVLLEGTLTPTSEITEIVVDNIMPTYSYLILEISSTSTNDGYLYLYDLLLNIGDKQSWSPASDELYSTCIRLSQLGITVLARGSGFATLMTSTEFAIYKASFNGDEVILGDLVSKFDDKGIKTTDIQCNSVSTTNYVMEDRNWGGTEHHIEYFKDDVVPALTRKNGKLVENNRKSRLSGKTQEETDTNKIKDIEVAYTRTELSKDGQNIITKSYNSDDKIISTTAQKIFRTEIEYEERTDI